MDAVIAEQTLSVVVGEWPREREREVLAALDAWAYTDENFDREDVLIDVLGGRPGYPTRRIAVYTPAPLPLAITRAWMQRAEARVRARIEALGATEIRVTVCPSPED